MMENYQNMSDLGPRPELIFHMEPGEEWWVGDSQELAEMKSSSTRQDNEKMNICTKCGTCFIHKLGLARHQRSHTEEKMVTRGKLYGASNGVLCGKLFQPKNLPQRGNLGQKVVLMLPKRSRTLKKHLNHKVSGKSPRDFMGKKPYKCQKCGKCFAHRATRVSHQWVHKEDKPCKFSEYGKGSALASNVSHHQLLCQGGKRHKCQACTKCSVRKAVFVTNQKLHTGEKLHRCRECQKCFAQNITLLYHQRTHKGENPKVCLASRECTPSTSGLGKHLRVCPRQEMYWCRECKKCFPCISQLLRHQRIHTGNKPYKCQECGKCFTSSLVLKKHRQIHTGEKPHQCQLREVLHSPFTACEAPESPHRGETL